jgi:hypothetical protein
MQTFEEATSGARSHREIKGQIEISPDLDEAGRRQHKVLPSDSKRLQEENFHCLSLSAGSQMATNQMDKHSLVFNHYKNHIGAGSQ